MSNLSPFHWILLQLPLVLPLGAEGQQLTTSCFSATFYMWEDYYLMAF